MPRDQEHRRPSGLPGDLGLSGFRARFVQWIELALNAGSRLKKPNLAHLRKPDLAMLRRVRKPDLATVLIVVGAVLLIYVGSQYYSMHREQRRLQAHWEKQQQTIASPIRATQPAGDPKLTRKQTPKSNLEAKRV